MSIRDRRGKFSISEDLLNDPSSEDALLKIMGRCLILRAEYMYCTGYIEYHAMSYYFDEIGNNMMPTEYEFTISNGGLIECNKVKR